jgi:plastocyanin
MLVVLAVTIALGATLPAAAATPTLKGLVGPGFNISMTKPKKAGTHKFVVQDKSNIHNFRLVGPGVNVATSVPAVGTKTFTVKLKAGAAYRFLCDPHPTSMKGSFRVPK